MKGVRYSEEFKAEAIKQVTERGFGVVEVAQRLGVSDKSLYKWLRDAQIKSQPMGTDVAALRGEVARLKAALKRTTEERDILKKAAVYFASQPE